MIETDMQTPEFLGPTPEEIRRGKCAARYRKWYAANKEKCTAYRRKWRAANKEKYAEYIRKWRSENKEKCTEYRERWRSNNPDKDYEIHRRAALKYSNRKTLCTIQSKQTERFERLSRQPKQIADLLAKGKDIGLIAIVLRIPVSKINAIIQQHSLSKGSKEAE